MKTPLIWALADNRAGNVAQVIGVAESLNLPYIRKDISYTKLSELPNFLKGTSLIGVDLKKTSAIEPTWPDLIISAGRKTAPISCYIKKRSFGKSKIIHLMRPEMPLKFFDLLAIPSHDNPLADPKIIKLIGAPNKINDKILLDARLKWEKELSILPSPKIALLVGGNTKLGIFSETEAQKLGNIINNFAKKNNGSLMISTSRRTPISCTKILQQTIEVPHYFYDANSQDTNPYLGFLAWADIIIVSGDSISMCSEACTTGKPVYIYSPANLIPNKHQSFHKQLYLENYARPFSDTLEIFVGKKLNTSEYLAKLIIDKFVYA